MSDNGDDVEVQVDASICIGYGNCVRTAPAVFAFDDERGVATVAAQAVVAEDQLRRAEQECPTGAIYVE